MMMMVPRSLSLRVWLLPHVTGIAEPWFYHRRFMAHPGLKRAVCLDALVQEKTLSMANRESYGRLDVGKSLLRKRSDGSHSSNLQVEILLASDIGIVVFYVV